jgi:RimJ/RimL family protein N-acetyltransferase
MSLYYSIEPSKNIKLFSDNILLSSFNLEKDEIELEESLKEIIPSLEEWKETLRKDLKSKTLFTCFFRKENRKFGKISISNSDHENKKLKMENIQFQVKDEILMMESLFILFDYLFDHCSFERIEFENENKIENLIQRLGFKKEGVVRMKRNEFDLYSLLKGDWNIEKETVKYLKSKL